MTFLRRFFCLTALAAAACAPAGAQTLRFETNVGNFDMVLNPDNDPNLQALVDNMVAYVGLGRYSYTAINRAAENFVLQMGGFQGWQPLPAYFAQNRVSVEALESVSVDGNGDGQVDFPSLANTRGEVSLALRAGDPNSGTSSFFINLGDNSFLDSQGFVPFARISNMTTIDTIMALMQSDQSGGSGDLSLSDIPILDNGRMVVVERVRVIESVADFSFTGPIVEALRAQQAAAAAAAAQSSAASIGAIPEPATTALAAIAALVLKAATRRRRR